MDREWTFRFTKEIQNTYKLVNIQSHWQLLLLLITFEVEVLLKRWKSDISSNLQWKMENKNCWVKVQLRMKFSLRSLTTNEKAER